MIRFLLLFICLHLCVITLAQQAFIPMPQEVSWQKGVVNVREGVQIINKGASQDEIKHLRDVLNDWKVLEREDTKEIFPLVLELLTNSESIAEEGYNLTINKEGLQLQARTDAGLFYGLQTLRQLEVKDQKLPFLEVKDEPAFSWRAFLLDVGRNYQPMDMLKEQIDVMAQYKLNVLHFHFTEDIAWRLVSQKYPGLTDAGTMTRWAGEYYTDTDFRELIAYCNDRHIQLLPEIDMPGHSAAFTRYFGVDMQSDSGMFYIKELLSEFRTNYPELEMLHIGGDEVKITNNNFMPEITRYVEQLGYKSTVGWSPGSNLMPQTWRQLWMGGPEVIKEIGDIRYIDSKHLYINHMDPLETVTTLFHRQIGGQNQEHTNLLGATLCSWPDRAVSKPIDMFYQSALYPSILVFAERIWRGGGLEQWVCNIMPNDTQEYTAFKEFEERLLTHKSRYFEQKPFPYVKQTDLKWELIGPYNNEGDLNRSFEIEQDPYDKNVQVSKTVEGGTIILRHWWADILQGAINLPQDRTTWYARTKIWSDHTRTGSFWVGFDNLSRSYASDSPAAHTWDNRESKLWVNAKEIAPPVWTQPGMRGDLEKPLLDEGYSFREPTLIPLKKGWNEVLIKLPVKDFKGRSWDNPVKWMFTFAPID